MKAKHKLNMIAELRFQLGGLFHRLLSSKRKIGTKGPIMREVRRLSELNTMLGGTPSDTDFLMDELEQLGDLMLEKRKMVEELRPRVITIRHTRSEKIVQNLINWLNSQGGDVADLAEIVGVDMMTAVKLWESYYPTTAGPHPRTGRFSFTPVSRRAAQRA